MTDEATIGSGEVAVSSDMADVVLDTIYDCSSLCCWVSSFVEILGCDAFVRNFESIRAATFLSDLCSSAFYSTFTLSMASSFTTLVLSVPGVTALALR